MKMIIPFSCRRFRSGVSRALLRALLIGVGIGSVAAADLDRDGLLDGWEAHYGFTVQPGVQPHGQHPEADPDGDGVPNLAESLAGTDPRRSGSVLRAELAVTPSGNLGVGFPSAATKRYVLEGSADFTDWQPIAATVGDSGWTTFHVEPSGDSTFFRVRVLPDVEWSDTNATPWEQWLVDGQPFSFGRDEDTDSLPDWWEWLTFGDLDETASDDADADGLSNGYEFRSGSDPVSKDSTNALRLSQRQNFPPSPSSILTFATTPTTAYLRWSASEDPEGDAIHYELLADGRPVRETTGRSATVSGLQPGATVLYGVEAVSDDGAVAPITRAVRLRLPDTSALPEPWQHLDLGSPDTPGDAHFDGQTFVLAGGGQNLGPQLHGSNLDQIHLVHRPAPGNFRLTARLREAQSVAPRSAAGLMVRRSLTGTDLMGAIVARASGIKWLQRTELGTFQNDLHVSDATAPRWLRLERLGGSLQASYSTDGESWITAAARSFDLGNNAAVGLFAHSAKVDEAVTATFDRVTFDLDSDGDGLFGGEDPDAAALDSDGDGYSDYEEVRFLFTDPRVHDLPPPMEVVAALGSSAVSLSGEWQINGTSISNVSTRGTVGFTVEIPQAGIHRLRISGQPRRNPTSDTAWSVPVSIDGHHVDTAVFHLANGQSGTAHVYTPWLQAGTHTIEISLDNVSVYRQFDLLGIALDRIGGDWMPRRLARLNHLSTAPLSSRTSPACIEGATRFPELLSLFAADAPIPVTPTIGDGWFADVPLDPVEPTTLRANFEQGGLTLSRTITWEPTNVLAGESLTIRRGDLLLLQAMPVTVDARATTLIVTRGGETIASHQVPAGGSAVHQFDLPGEYLVSADSSDGSPSLTVRVVAAAFSEPEAVAITDYQRAWANPNLSPEAIVEADSRLDLTDVPAGTGRTFKLRTSEIGDLGVIARLPGASGAILDATQVHAVRLNSSRETGIYYVEEYPDGSSLVEMRLTLSEPRTDLTFRLNIFIAGVLFEDGTTTRTFTAADFNDLGELVVRFLVAPGVNASVCHNIRAYQDGEILTVRTN